MGESWISGKGVHMYKGVGDHSQGGYSDILIHTYARVFLGFKILNFNILGCFFLLQKNEYFGGFEDFVDIFWGVTTKFDYI